MFRPSSKPTMPLMKRKKVSKPDDPDPDSFFEDS